MSIEFAIVDRPAVMKRHSLARAIADTLTTGRAVAIPINGETYAVVRNRKAATASLVAKKLGAESRTMKSDDGLYVLLWLEPKADRPTGEQKEAK